MKVNVGGSGKARLIMRNKGNFRLLLNANIWSGMKVTPMDGGKVPFPLSQYQHLLASLANRRRWTCLAWEQSCSFFLDARMHLVTSIVAPRTATIILLKL